MARKRTEQPAYQYHVSGQAKVRLGHVDFYLGKHGTPESYARYYALLAEYNAGGKQSPVKQDQPPETHQADSVILVKHVTADFRHRVLPTHEHRRFGDHSSRVYSLDRRLRHGSAMPFGASPVHPICAAE